MTTQQQQPPQGYAPRQPTSNNTTALWVIAGVIGVIALVMLFGADCGKKQHAPRQQQQRKSDTMTVRMKVRNPHLVALERIRRLERALRNKTEALDKARKDATKAEKEHLEADIKRLKTLKEKAEKLAKDLKEALEELRKETDEEERARLIRKIRRLKRALDKKPPYITRWRTRTPKLKKKDGDSILEQKLDRLGRELKELHGRVKAAHPKGQGSTSTGMAAGE